MKNASSLSPRGWRHTLAILTVALLIVLGAVFGLALPCGGATVFNRLSWKGLTSFFPEIIATVD